MLNNVETFKNFKNLHLQYEESLKTIKEIIIDSIGDLCNKLRLEYNSIYNTSDILRKHLNSWKYAYFYYYEDHLKEIILNNNEIILELYYDDYMHNEKIQTIKITDYLLTEEGRNEYVKNWRNEELNKLVKNKQGFRLP